LGALKNATNLVAVGGLWLDICKLNGTSLT